MMIISATLASDLLSSLASFESKYSSYLSDIIIPHVILQLFPLDRLGELNRSLVVDFA
jgi:hypothetical protein